jgi:fido (protein-threonine AMPylation protein)
MVDRREYENTAAAYEYAVAFHLEHEDRSPYHVGVILELHSIISRDLYDFAGQTRDVTIQVEIGGADFTPAAAHLINNALVDLCERARIAASTATTFAERIRLCSEVFHELLYIHPFQDGNGRTARAFLLLMLYNLGLLSPPLQIFDYIAYRRDEYLRCLKEADHGRKESLVAFVKRGTQEALDGFVAQNINADTAIAAQITRRMDRRAVKFLDVNHRFRLTGIVYERERRHFYNEATRAANQLLRQAQREAGHPRDGA